MISVGFSSDDMMADFGCYTMMRAGQIISAYQLTIRVS